MYIARISDKQGRPLFRSRCHDTRQAAAREAFAARPKAKIASTCHAYFDDRAQDWRENGSDVQWCRLDDVKLTV